jgi:hypothetical protein
MARSRGLGDVYKRQGQDLQTTTRNSLGRTPAALLAWPGGRPVGADGEAAQTIIDGAQVVLRSLWVVYLIVDDPRPDEAAYVGGTGEPGMLDLVQTTCAKILGLRIAGLWDAEPRPVLVDVKVGRIVPRATMVYVVTFATHATITTVEPLPDAEPLERVDGETGPTESTEDLLVFTADTTAT